MEKRNRAIADRDVVGSREGYYKKGTCMLMEMIQKKRKNGCCRNMKLDH